MSIKVLAGDWEPGTACVFEEAIFGKPDRIRMGRVFGDEYGADEIASIDIVTEQNSTSIVAKVGWGFAGSVLLGPLGMFAGLLGGGNRHEKVVAMELVSGKRALLQCDAKNYGQIIRLGFKKRGDLPNPDTAKHLPPSFRNRDPQFETVPRRVEVHPPTTPDILQGVRISFGDGDKK